MAFPALLANYVNYGNGSSTGYYAVAKWAAAVNYVVGNLVRPLTDPAVGNERVYVCTTAGLSVTEPTWTFTRGALQTGTVEKFTECTGQPATNGDLTNTIRWSVVKNTAVSLGVIIKDASNNLFICTTAGTAGNGAEPTWNTTIGNTTADNTVTWTCIANGAYGNGVAPHARTGNANGTNWASAGDDIYIGDNSAETQTTSLTLTSPGTAASPCRYLCHDHAGTYPPAPSDLKTVPTASITTTGTTNLILLGRAYWLGLKFSAGTSGNPTIGCGAQSNGNWHKFEGCSWALGAGTGASSAMSIQAFNLSNVLDAAVEFENVTLSFSNAGQEITVGPGRFRWRNTPTAIGGTLPTTLFKGGGASAAGQVNLEGVDLSALGSGKNLIDASTTEATNFNVVDCKLGASVSITTGNVAGQGGRNIRFVNCDSADTVYRYFKQTYQGTITHETTIVRTGGATDGTTPVSRKMVSTANSKFYAPLESDPIIFWNTNLNSQTITVPVITGNVTLLTTDAWIEVEYLGTSGNPLGKYANYQSGLTVLDTGTNQPTDSTSTWTTTGLGTPVKQSLQATFTALKAGPVRVWVMLARASTTMYFDPQVIPSPKRSVMVGESGYVNEDTPVFSASSAWQGGLRPRAFAPGMAR